MFSNFHIIIIIGKNTGDLADATTKIMARITTATPPTHKCTCITNSQFAVTCIEDNVPSCVLCREKQ